MSTLSSPDIYLRVERPEDTAATREVNRAAFERDAEARLVDALRAANAVTLSAVAVLGASRLDDDEAAQPAQGRAGRRRGRGTNTVHSSHRQHGQR
jgi:hypothetical protein